MGDLERDFFKGGGDEREGAEIVPVAVALNYLRSDGRNAEPKALANALFHFRAEMRSIADGAGNFANGHLRGGLAEARDIALIFREPIGDFQATRDAFLMNPCRPADLRTVPNF